MFKARLLRSGSALRQRHRLSSGEESPSMTIRCADGKSTLTFGQSSYSTRAIERCM